MHVVFAIRGIKDKVEKFINELSTHYLPTDLPRADGQPGIEKRLLQIRVCPIQLYDISFASENKEIVFNTIFWGTKGNAIHKRFDYFAKVVRKILGLKPIPEYKTDLRIPMCPPQDTEIIGLGIKEDYFINSKGEHVKEKGVDCYEGI